MPHKPLIKIGGVPEHFNLPWVEALEQNKFRHLPAEISWNYFPGGTGAMTQALSNGDLDIAILLTEGFIAAAIKGLKAGIIHRYISTPLNWGIYSGIQQPIEWTKKTKIAISRKGSGSHLMAKIHSRQMGFELDESQFIEVHHLEDAITSLQNSETDYFFWEHWMTLKYVQSQRVVQLGNFSAPWSGFLVVASNQCIAEKADLLKSIIEIIKKESQQFIGNPQSPSNIARRFQLTPAEAELWMKAQTWNLNDHLDQEELQNAMQSLNEIGLFHPSLLLNELKAPWLTWQ
jgi:ABC-type nitrate/sulfonate/bicarbonate transport system substrate-binding protein